MMRPLWIWSTNRSRSRFLSSRSTSASMPWAIHAAFQPTLPAPSTTTRAGRTPGAPAEQHTATAVVALEVVGADLGRHAPGHLAHRRQQRQRAVLELHGLVGQRRGAGGEQGLGHLGVGGQVQVGEQHQVGPEEAELGRLRLLDLDHQLGAPRLGRRPPCGPRRRRSRRRRSTSPRPRRARSAPRGRGARARAPRRASWRPGSRPS